MFCYQCEQTAKGTGCTVHGVCGKAPDVAALQDLLVYALKGVSQYAHRAAALGARDAEIDRFTVEALFTTLTNVNFDPEALAGYIRRAAEVRDHARKHCEQAARTAGRKPEMLSGPAAFEPAAERGGAMHGRDARATIHGQDARATNARATDAGATVGLLEQAKEVGIESRRARLGDDVAGLNELIVYGLKGAAAYLDHAAILGVEDPAAYALFHQLLDFVASENTDPAVLTTQALRAGELNLQAMQLLDAANTGAYGHPVPTPVRITHVKGKAIAVSGHDLKDLEELLKQTEGKGISVYTHGEMLPAHGYPGLKKHKHLVGNYGGAWQNQAVEFAAFPGAILMTTNCIQKPQQSYQGRIFTCGAVGWPGARHINDRNFKAVIEAALAAPGFTETAPEKSILVGFARNAVLGVAPQVIEAVKSGAIRRFFLIGGCDGAKPGRNYYTEFAQAVPKDCVILTLACGKYRFNMLEFGDIGGIPRLLDVGQCNDAYSAVQIALALAGAFKCGVNDLPLSFILSWYEQKAVAILLTLLALGIRDIRLGPSLPAFVTPAVLKVLVDKFNITPISTPEQDLEAILGR